MKGLVLALLLLTMHGAVFAQGDGRELRIDGALVNGEVRVRWASGSPVVWSLIKANGILLLRQEAGDSVATVMNNGAALRVWSEQQWEAYPERETAGQVVTLLRDREQDRSGLSEYGAADLEQNKLTGLLLIAEFRFGVAEGLALGYRDRDVRPEGLYRYEVMLPDPVRGDTLRAECFVNMAEEHVLPPVTGLKVTAADGALQLGWDRFARHSGFYIERRDGGSSSWLRLNSIPRIYADNYPGSVLFTDSVRNDIEYEYRVIGVDAFGRESEAMETVKAKAGDFTAPQAPYDIAAELAPRGVTVRWTVPPRESDLAGYGLLRSENPNEGFLPVHPALLPPGTATFTDTLQQTGTYFYRMIAADTKGNISPMSTRAMIVIDDTIPPPAPVGLTALADTNGIITLRWRQRLENDVAGYRVYRIIGGGAKPEFVPLNPEAMIDTVWTDTLMAGVRDRFLYRVRTVDFAGNYSAPSEAVGIQLPDNVPPARPVMGSYRVADKRVTLRFISASKDVRFYRVRREQVKSSDPPLEARVPETQWMDSTARHGVAYRYSVVAVDSVGNTSPPSDAVHVLPFWSVDIPTPAVPVVSYDAGSKVVRVRWSMPAEGFSTIVFRRQGDAPFLQVSPLLEGTEFVDSTATGGRYEYALKHFYPEQGGTDLGAAAAVEVR